MLTNVVQQITQKLKCDVQVCIQAAQPTARFSGGPAGWHPHAGDCWRSQESFASRAVHRQSAAPAPCHGQQLFPVRDHGPPQTQVAGSHFWGSASIACGALQPFFVTKSISIKSLLAVGSSRPLSGVMRLLKLRLVLC